MLGSTMRRTPTRSRLLPHPQHDWCVPCGGEVKIFQDKENPWQNSWTAWSCMYLAVAEVTAASPCDVKSLSPWAPNGGNGGNGGAVILRVDNQTTTLLEYHHSPHQHAPNGDIGRGDMHHGFNGEDLILTVPQGTVVKDREGNVLADLLRVGDEYVAARGGMGGLGNAALASAKRKAPGFALLGTPGEEADIVLELKSIADVALVGYPSAGKSSLIAAISAARPKIADYPFTTLIPNLGVVQAGDVRYTVADVPGLIEGASEARSGTASCAMWSVLRLWCM